MSVADSLLAFSLAALVLTLTPGLDTALILRTSAAEGGKIPSAPSAVPGRVPPSSKPVATIISAPARSAARLFAGVGLISR